MLSSICNDCKRLGKNCQGLKKDSTYTGCAQKETTLTFYGQQILKDFKERCKNVIGRDYFDKVCNSPDGTTMLNNCVASDEGLAAWLIFTYEDIPTEIIPLLKKWSDNSPDAEISVILYSDKDMADTVGSYTTTVGRVIKILEKSINDIKEEPPAVKYEVVEILGQKALFTEERVYEDKIPNGLFSYDLREVNDSDVFSFSTLEKDVVVNHAGSIITLEPIDLGTDGYIELSDDEDTSPNFTGEEITIEEYVKGSEEYTTIASNKKSNVTYWDSIDYITEEYVKHIASMGYLGKKLDEQDLLEIGKPITEKITQSLKDDYGYQFPYVEGDY